MSASHATRHSLRPSAALACLLLGLSIPACRRDPAPAPGGVGPHTYTVRAEVLRLPDPSKPGAELVVRHEAIDDFVDDSGAGVGMDAMEMPLPASASVPARGLAVGDAVSLRFTVDFAGPTLRVEQLERLPPGTALRFGPAHPPAGSGAKR